MRVSFIALFVWFASGCALDEQTEPVATADPPAAARRRPVPFTESDDGSGRQIITFTDPDNCPELQVDHGSQIDPVRMNVVLEYVGLPRVTSFSMDAEEACFSRHPGARSTECRMFRGERVWYQYEGGHLSVEMALRGKRGNQRSCISRLIKSNEPY